MKKLLLAATAITALSVGSAQAAIVLDWGGTVIGTIVANPSGSLGPPAVYGDLASATSVTMPNLGMVTAPPGSSDTTGLTAGASFLLGTSQNVDVNPFTLSFVIGSTVYKAFDGDSSMGYLETLTLVQAAWTPNASTGGTWTLSYNGTIKNTDNDETANASMTLALTQNTTGATIVGQINESSTLISVPEPASMALLGAGLLGLGFARRRRG